MVKKVLEVSEELFTDHKISCEVVDPRTIRPLDINLILNSVKKTGRLVCVEEACGFGGFMGEVAAQVAQFGFDWLDAPILRITGRNCPVPYCPILENEMIPGHERIKKGILDSVKNL
jgi:pyruvate dehydrogenase E1 component beta subunit